MAYGYAEYTKILRLFEEFLEGLDVIRENILQKKKLDAANKLNKEG